MSESHVILKLDASEYLEVFNAGLEAGFLLAKETPELDEQLNLNNISDPDDE